MTSDPIPPVATELSRIWTASYRDQRRWIRQNLIAISREGRRLEDSEPWVDVAVLLDWATRPEKADRDPSCAAQVRRAGADELAEMIRSGKAEAEATHRALRVVIRVLEMAEQAGEFPAALEHPLKELLSAEAKAPPEKSADTLRLILSAVRVVAPALVTMETYRELRRRKDLLPWLMPFAYGRGGSHEHAMLVVDALAGIGTATWTRDALLLAAYGSLPPVSERALWAEDVSRNGFKAQVDESAISQFLEDVGMTASPLRDCVPAGDPGGLGPQIHRSLDEGPAPIAFAAT